MNKLDEHEAVTASIQKLMLVVADFARDRERRRCEQWIKDHLNDKALESFRAAIREGGK